MSVSQSVPPYCRQRERGRSDRAFVRFDGGKKTFLGKYGSPESLQLYNELIGASKAEAVAPSKDPTVAEIMAAYLSYAESYYRKNGTTTREYEMMREVCKMVRSTCSTLPAREFGPKKLKAVRQLMIDKGHSRKYINGNIDRIRRMFKWAAGEELIEPSIPQALSFVAGLRRGRTTAPDRPPVLPVADAVVEATLQHLPEVIADMVRLQRATGMRPAELCMLRPCDVDRSSKIWLYRPAAHKTQHHGKDRVVLIGPRGQGVLLKYLARAADAYCFSPTDSEAKRRAAQHEARQTPLGQGNRPGTNLVDDPQRRPGEKYDTNSYRRAIHRGCDRAGIPRWSPNRLRHSAATEIRREFGLEGSQIILGHATMSTTQIYAEKDMALGLRIAAKIG